MTSLDTKSIASPEAATGTGSSHEPAASEFTLLADLEASLLASQRAVLTRNRSELERRTAEQDRMQRELRCFADRRTAPSDPVAGPVHAARQRVLHLGRVQRELLARAQRSLTAISTCMAGPHASYAPASGHPGIALRAAYPSSHLFPAQEA